MMYALSGKAKIETYHHELFKSRGISIEFASQSGVISIADNEAKALGFGAMIPKDHKEGLQGLLFPYRSPVDLSLSTYRLRPDRPPIKEGKPAKYLSLIGSGCQLFLPHTFTVDISTDPKWNIVITEGEFKALAIAEVFASLQSNRKSGVIGIEGVNGGWHRETTTHALADGSHEKKKTGPVRLIDALQEIEWKKRTVYICFDSDVSHKKHATEFKRSKYSGAIGAEHVLADLLRARGAEVRLVEIPANGHEKLGADDYIAKYGKPDFLRTLWNNWVPSRNVDEIIARDSQGVIKLQTAIVLSQAQPEKPAFIVDSLLPDGGTLMIAAAPKVGKSSLALHLCACLARGEKFLARYACIRGAAAYIQSEIPDWAMSERLKLLGVVPQNLYVLNPGKFALNFWEEDGYQKRRETGNRDRVERLVEVLVQKSVKLVIFDPLRHFHSLNENSVEHTAHLFEVFRAIARLASCGVGIVHHHRKIGRSQVKYEGAEDMSGSGALFGEADSIISIYKLPRSDATYRLKAVFDTRHCEQPDALELHRLAGTQSMNWEADLWEDHASGASGAGDMLLDVLRLGDKRSGELEAIAKADGISRATLFRTLTDLRNSGRITKIGNLYHVTFSENYNS